MSGSYVIKQGSYYWTGAGWVPSRGTAQRLSRADALRKRDRMKADGIEARAIEIRKRP